MLFYAWLLRLLPGSFRDEYGAELLDTFEQHRAEVRRDGGLRSRVRFWLREGLAVVRLAVRLRLRLEDGEPANADRAGGRSVTRTERSLRALLLLELRETRRSLLRNPGPNLAIVTVLAFCVATAAVVFSLMDGILRRPLPYPAPDEVVLVGPRWLDGRQSSGYVAAAEYLEVAGRSSAFRGIGAIDHVERTMLGRGEPRELAGALVSASAFEVLGVSPALGRLFTVDEDLPDGPAVIVLSHALWSGAFGSDPDILGRVVRLEDRGFEVIGVMPAGFLLPTEAGAPDPSAFYLPLAVDPADPGPFFIKELDAIVARLAPGVGIEAATADLERIASLIVAEHPDNYRPDEWTLTARSPVEAAVAEARPLLRLLAAAVAFLVLAVCVNLAGLLSSRAEDRRTDVAVRTALGAGRMHVVRRVVLEGVLLVVAGGLAGIAAAAYALPLVRVALEGVLPRIRSVELDLRVVVLTLVAFLTTALLFTIAPALRAAKTSPALPARWADRGSRSRAGFRRLIIGGQLAIASLLLCGSSLFVRSTSRLMSINPGFRAAGVRTIELSLPSARYPSAAGIESFYARLVADLEAAPGIEEVGLARRRPMADRYGTWTVAVRGDGESRRLDDDPPRWQVVTPGYFRALSIPLEEGRVYTRTELTGRAGVAVVNRAFADRYWSGRSAVGTGIRMDGGQDNPWLTVVGVVGDVMIDGPAAPAAPILYVPHPHFAAATSAGAQRSMSVVLRTRLDDAAVATLLRSTLTTLDPELPHGAVRSMDAIVAASFAENRVLTQVVSIFALLALVLGAIGVYGVLRYEVASRSREIGIRVALGAEGWKLVGLVLRDGLNAAVTGAAVGITAAWILADSVAAYLYEVDARDPITFILIPLVLLLTTLAASYVPARRAASADPAVTLRSD